MDRRRIAAICCSLGLSLLVANGAVGAEAARPAMLIVVGAGGTPEYEAQFQQWAQRWQDLSQTLDAEWNSIGLAADSAPDREQLTVAIQRYDQPAEAPLMLVLIGHGTAQGDAAKFNLRGPDFTAQELATWLSAVQRPVVVAQCASCSGAFLQPLAAANRIVITATQSGAEQNFARFGDFFSTAVTEPAADLDHDDTVSLLEAFLLASDRVAKSYEQQSRLATEHALLDDNGDGWGTPAHFFSGIRATKAARNDAPLDGLRAHQILLFRIVDRPALTPEKVTQRDQIEQQVEQLRLRKSSLDADEYYEQLEPLMIQLARLCAEVDP